MVIAGTYGISWTSLPSVIWRARRRSGRDCHGRFGGRGHLQFVESCLTRRRTRTGRLSGWRTSRLPSKRESIWRGLGRGAKRRACHTSSRRLPCWSELWPSASTLTPAVMRMDRCGCFPVHTGLVAWVQRRLMRGRQLPPSRLPRGTGRNPRVLPLVASCVINIYIASPSPRCPSRVCRRRVA